MLNSTVAIHIVQWKEAASVSCNWMLLQRNLNNFHSMPFWMVNGQLVPLTCIMLLQRWFWYHNLTLSPGLLGLAFCVCSQIIKIFLLFVSLCLIKIVLNDVCENIYIYNWNSFLNELQGCKKCFISIYKLLQSFPADRLGVSFSVSFSYTS